MRTHTHIHERMHAGGGGGGREGEKEGTKSRVGPLSVLIKGGQKRGMSDFAKIKAALQEICENPKVGDTVQEMRGVWNVNEEGER